MYLPEIQKLVYVPDNDIREIIPQSAYSPDIQQAEEL